MPRPPKSRAFPPLSLLRAGEVCPTCHHGTNVFALAASALYDAAQESTLDCPLILRDIESLPKRLLSLFTTCCPGWRLDRDDPDEPPYLMNHCLRCGSRLTDFYLHAEPGSAFFPTGPEECWNITLFPVPAKNPVALTCSYTAGGLSDWLDAIKTQSWPPAPPAP
jgi:hypothetical protein